MSRMDKLDILLKNELISKSEYETIVQLRYEKPKEDEKMVNEEEKDYSYDDITKFDKEKENMSIACLKFQSFSDAQNKPYNW